MADKFEEAYPEASHYINKAVAEHSEEWVLENYYVELYPLGQIIDMPKKSELPFFDEDIHEEQSDEELAEMYDAWASYRENLKNAGKSSEE